MFDWIKRRIALWGWWNYENVKQLKIITPNEHRSVHVRYNYKGDVEISVCNTNKPFTTIARLKVAYPNLNTVEFQDLQNSGDKTT